MTPDEQIAYALETEVELLPWIPELLADLPALGSDPEEITEIVRSLALEPGAAHVLDLGSGKGAVAVALARELGHRVTGFELFPPFVEASRELALRAGVAELCTFHPADLRDALRHTAPADVALYLALGDLLGPPEAIVGALRPTLRPGGYLVIGDAYLADPSLGGSGSYEGYFGRGETLERLLSLGDRLVEERVESVDDVIEENAQNNAAIQRRAAWLIARHPELESAVRGFVSRQLDECRVLEQEMICTTWVLERGG